jgi:hypothetical protein
MITDEDAWNKVTDAGHEVARMLDDANAILMLRRLHELEKVLRGKTKEEIYSKIFEEWNNQPDKRLKEAWGELLKKMI